MSSHGRSNRSASIPIPRSIEAALPLTFGISPGSLPRSRPGSSVGGIGVRGHVTLAGTSPSSSRHTPARSFTTPHPLGTSQSPVEPRRIRANGGVGPSRSVGDNDGSPHVPPLLSRRRSVASNSTGVPSIGAAGPLFYRAPSSSHHAPRPPSPQPLPAAFAPPAYLAHSALRHLLQTEAAPTLPPSRYANPDASSTAPSVVWPHIKHREVTPGTDSEDESPPPRDLSLPPSVLISSSPILRLPTRWSDQDRYPSLSVSSDGSHLSFTGPALGNDKDAAAARTNHPIPPACGIYYYEVQILSKGTRGGITIGLAAGQVRLSRIPGYEAHSWGYRGEDGLVFASDKNGSPYGPRFEDHDVIGCGIDFTSHRAFFTRNGRFLGNVFEDVGKDCDVYPCVSLRQQGEAISVNFGHRNFAFDINDYVQQQRNLVWANIQSTPIKRDLLGRFDHSDHSQPAATARTEDGESESWESSDLEEVERVRAPLGRLVLEYLEHHGYAKTAQAFRTQFDHLNRAALPDGGRDKGVTPVPVPVPSSSRTLDEDLVMDDLTQPDSYKTASSFSNGDSVDGLDARLHIVNAVTAGDIDTAIDKTTKQFPKVLEENEGLMLVKLKCRKFVELVLQASDAMKRMKEEQRLKDDSRERDDDPMGVSAMDIDDSDALPMPAPGTNGFPPRGVRDGSATNGSTDYPTSSSSTPALSYATSEYHAALSAALSYGQKLRSDYKSDSRAEVQALFKRTFGIVAYEDPASAGAEIAEIVGPEAKAALANELNIAILKSQGRPSHPALEQLYRQAAACVEQLGLFGVGAAAFADMSKEFLDE